MGIKGHFTLVLVFTFSIVYKFSKREFPGGPVVKTWCFHYDGLGSIPGQGTKIPQAKWYSQKKKIIIN